MAIGMMNKQLCVVYKSVDNSLTWVRHLSDWQSWVYYEGVFVPRFSCVNKIY